MVDNLGRWIPEEEYSNYPREQWCDMDVVANYIKEQNYESKTSVKNLAYMIVALFEGDAGDYFSAYNQDLTIRIDELSAFVEASGGLKEFDYEC